MVWGAGPPCRPGRPARLFFLRGPAWRPPSGSIWRPRPLKRFPGIQVEGSASRSGFALLSPMSWRFVQMLEADQPLHHNVKCPQQP